MSKNIKWERSTQRTHAARAAVKSPFSIPGRTRAYTWFKKEPVKRSGPKRSRKKVTLPTMHIPDGYDD